MTNKPIDERVAELEKLAEVFNQIHQHPPVFQVAMQLIRDLMAERKQPAPRYTLRMDGSEVQAQLDAQPAPQDVVERVKQLEEALAYAATMLEIASDWNAPKHYDMEVSEEYDDTKDADSAEPTWVASYLFVPKLWQILKQEAALPPAPEVVTMSVGEMEDYIVKSDKNWRCIIQPMFAGIVAQALAALCEGGKVIRVKE